MMILTNVSVPSKPVSIKKCNTFFQRLRGLMMTSQIDEYQGIALYCNPPGIANASIHMFFMRYTIAAIWLDSHNRVIDKAIALPWKPYYAPSTAAAVILELHPDRIRDYNVGDQVDLTNA